MSKNENNAMFVENIYTLAKLYGLKIGEVEDKAGISRGYVSRLKKAGENANVQDDTVKKIADVFGCSAEAILCHDLRNMGKDALYYFDFVLKLYEDTKHGIVVLDVDDMTDMKLFISEEEYEKCQYKYFYQQNMYKKDNGELVKGYRWISRFLYDASTNEYAFVERNFIWSYQIEENIKLLLVGTELWNHEYGEEYNVENSNGWHAELYLDKGGRFIPLCASYNNNELAGMLIELWSYLVRFGETPRLTDEVKEVIDEFMGKKHNVSEEQSVEKVGIIEKKNIPLKAGSAKKELETMLMFNSRSKKVVDM